MSIYYRPFQPTLTHAGLSRLGLVLESRGPCNALKGIVHSYLQIKAKRQTHYPVMPDGTQAVYISRQGSLIGGAQIEAKTLQLLQPGDYFGIWFYPGALRYFFDLNLSEISGQFADEKYFQCQKFMALHNDIYRYETFADRANACEMWLLGRYSEKPVTRFDEALSLIYQSSGGAKISNIADKIGWSSRHLNRQFLQYTGLSTKAFSQIIRAQHLCKQLYLNSTEALALELGYYDQPHLIKDFKKYFKSTPGEFLNRFMSDFYNH